MEWGPVNSTEIVMISEFKMCVAKKNLSPTYHLIVQVDQVQMNWPGVRGLRLRIEPITLMEAKLFRRKQTF